MTTPFTNDLQLLPEVKAFLNREIMPAMVGGREVMAASGATLATIDPGSGQQLAEIQDLDASEIDQAVDVANAAFPPLLLHA